VTRYIRHWFFDHEFVDFNILRSTFPDDDVVLSIEMDALIDHAERVEPWEVDYDQHFQDEIGMRLVEYEIREMLLDVISRTKVQCHIELRQDGPHLKMISVYEPNTERVRTGFERDALRIGGDIDSVVRDAGIGRLSY